MQKYLTVTLEPIGISTRISTGCSIYQISVKTGTPIGGECGGIGRCGKCKVIVDNFESVSPVSEVERNLLSKEELDSKFRFACQTQVFNDLTVYIPPSTSQGLRRVQVDAVERSVSLDPAIRKIALCLHKPSLSDARSDLKRLSDNLGKSLGTLDVDLELIKKLPIILRDSSWRITSVLWDDRRILDIESGDTTQKTYGLAVDIGTSKIVVQLTDLNSGRTIATKGSENPQLVYGEDVVDRVKVSEEPGMLETLQELVVKEINDLLKVITDETNVNPVNIYEAVVVGNTVMTHIFLGISPRYVAFSPFTPAVTRPFDTTSSRLGLEINPYGMVHLPPNIAGFVGADATADLIASGLLESEKLKLQLDIGTNTEVFLGNEDGVTTCSCASGPAFEGAHIKHGMKAVTGAIERVIIRPDVSSVEYLTIGEEPPRGLCGSSVVDLVAELFRHGILSERGRFRLDSTTDRLRSEGGVPEFVVAWRNETATGTDIVLTQKDVNEILLAKAAIYTGCSVLMKNKGIGKEQIEEILVGGAFGCYINPENAITVGLLPDVTPEKISFRGNLALLGAKIVLVSKGHRKLEENVRSKVDYIELTTEPIFKTEFTNALFLPNRNLDLFPADSIQPQEY